MDICKEIIEQAEELFDCSLFNGYTRIETPFIYPDGDVIDLFYRFDAPDKIITDLGGTSNWLGLQAISDDRTKKQKSQIKYICQTYRIEQRKGEFFIDLGKGNEIRNLADAVFDLGQAMIRISGLWFLQNSKPKSKSVNPVEIFMENNEIKFKKNKPFKGNSGDTWKPSFYVEIRKNKKFLIYFLSTKKKDYASNITCRVNTAWDDLLYLKNKEQYTFISLFDDRYDVWKASDKKILKRNSVVKHLSNRNDLKNTLIGIT